MNYGERKDDALDHVNTAVGLKYPLAIFVVIAIAILGLIFMQILKHESHSTPIHAAQPLPSTSSKAINVNTHTPPPASASETTYKMGEAAKVGEFLVTVKGTAMASRLYSELSATHTEGQFIIFLLTLTNSSDKPRYIGSNMFELVDATGRPFKAYQTTMKINGIDALHYEAEAVDPGLTRKCYIVFETPKGTKPAELKIADGVTAAKMTTVKIALPNSRSAN